MTLADVPVVRHRRDREEWLARSCGPISSLTLARLRVPALVPAGTARMLAVRIHRRASMVVLSHPRTGRSPRT